MSCYGCQALGRSCTNTCVLRPCLRWIQSPQAQTNAVVFLNNYFGSNFIPLVSAIPEAERTAGFRSLLFEACGRLLYPAFGVIGMRGHNMFDLCKDAVATVLAGGTLTPIPYTLPPDLTLLSGSSSNNSNNDEMKTLDLFK